MIAEQFERLAGPRLSPEKAALARRLCHEVEAAAAPAEDAGAVERRAAAAARAVLAAARSSPGGEELVHLRLFAAACRRLLASVLDVRNFDRRESHALFALVETSLVSRVLWDLRAAPTARAASPAPERAPEPAAEPAADIDELRAFLRHCHVDWSALRACGIVLALAERPVAKLAEIVGFARAAAHALAALSVGSPNRPRYLAAWRSLRRAASQADPAGVLRGARVFDHCMRLVAAAAERSPARIQERAARILAEKARYAMLHHRNEVLAGRRLVDWFSDKPFRSVDMLAALAASPWIDREDVERSRFFRSLTARGGMMDGVFHPAELAVLKQHFRAGVAPSDQSGVEASEAEERGEDQRESAATEPLGEPLGDRPLPAAHDHRGRYFALLDAEGDARAGEIARAALGETFAELAAIGRSGASVPLLAPFPYQRAAVEERIAQLYWFQAERVGALRFDLDADELRTFHLHFAPFGLIDGCWLRRAVAGEGLGAARRALGRIYADEVGNGEHRHNHANLYGRLLRELGWRFSSVNDPLLGEAAIPRAAFKAPAFLLALDVVQADHVPELLGVTLAIEMSGLDGLYERVIASLERHGFSASYWRLHVSVDNFSTGHARQSLDAALDFMEETAETYGEALAAPVWSRIWTGFLSMLYLFDGELRLLAGASRGGSA